MNNQSSGEIKGGLITVMAIFLISCLIMIAGYAFLKKEITDGDNLPGFISELVKGKATLELASESDEVKPAQSLNLKLVLAYEAKTKPLISDFQFELIYDQELFEAPQIEIVPELTALGKEVAFNDKGSGRFMILVFGGSEIIPTGNVLTISFLAKEAVAEGQTEISLADFKAVDLQGNYVEKVNVKNKEIIIK